MVSRVTLDFEIERLDIGRGTLEHLNKVAIEIEQETRNVRLGIFAPRDAENLLQLFKREPAGNGTDVEQADISAPCEVTNSVIED